ncbi:MAG TPA: sulfatase-like hydrolase/transferase [Planctomycetaceae bacterium]|jgi:arylsulfatase A-like enzyme|nr:sulfatase-like hydrolase/transferase [Planctomycetaceae bacterium]
MTPRAVSYLIVGLALLSGWPRACGANPARPNVLIILADDLSHGDLSCCGGQGVQTPNIDRIFHEGISLTRFRTNSSVCSPTRAALLTGRYPDCVGVPGVIRTHPEDSWGELSQDAVLLPAVLRPAGFSTALIGKWHLGLRPPNVPTERGFELFRGFLGDMMDDYQTHLRHGINYMRHNTETIAPTGHATDLFTEWGIDFLRARRHEQGPFFLLLAYNAPHAHIQPPEDWLRRVHQREPHLPQMRARRVALVEHLDAGVGGVMSALAAAGLERETLVIFTSDNGGPIPDGATNASFRDGKGSMYEGGLRVPFAARWPGRITANSSSDLAAVTMDLFPTALAAAGVALPKNIDGVSLWSTLLGKRQTVKRPLFFVRREGGRPFLGKSIDAVIDGDWKLVHNSPFAPLELFNLRDDPGEAHNRADRERKKLDELARLLQHHTQTAGAVPWQKLP